MKKDPHFESLQSMKVVDLYVRDNISSVLYFTSDKGEGINRQNNSLTLFTLNLQFKLLGQVPHHRYILLLIQQTKKLVVLLILNIHIGYV